MALDDIFDSEIAVAVAATAAVLSPKVRGAVRQGAVYGVAGVLTAGDAIGSFVQGVGRGAKQGARAAGVEAVVKETSADAPKAAEEETPTDAPKATAEPRSRRVKSDAAGEQ